MRGKPIQQKEYIVYKRHEPDLTLQGFEREYVIISEIPLPHPVMEYSQPKIGTKVTKTGANGQEYICTILKPRILSCNGHQGKPDNVIMLYETEVEYTPHLASTPPMLFRPTGDTQKIGIILIATGKYHSYVAPVIASAQKHLFNGHSLTFFVFTDDEKRIKLPPTTTNVKFIHWPHKPFPYPTLYRYKAMVQHANQLSKMDYLYYSDVDMKFVDKIGNEAIGSLVATLHPGYVGKVGTPERRANSKAYIPLNVQNKYYAGGFNGGSAAQFLRMATMLNDHITEDEEKGIIAIWHDESHLNWYLHHCKPTVVLDPGYCYPEKAQLPYKKRLLALDKDHKKIRSET